MINSNYFREDRKYDSNIEKLERVEELESREGLTLEESAESLILYSELGLSLAHDISPDYSLEDLEEVLRVLDAHEAEDYETLKRELNYPHKKP
jgi:hypothetical protein